MTSALELAASNALTAMGTWAGAWALLRGKRVENDGDERVAEITAEPAFAAQLLEALDRLDRERQLVAQLRIDLAAVTSQRDALSGQVLELSARLAETDARLGELNQHLLTLSRSVQEHLPQQRPPT